VAGVLASVVALAGCSTTVAPPVAAPVPQDPNPTAVGPPTPRTVVSLTFDDGNGTQYTIFPELLEHGMRATFYVNTGLVDRGDTSVMTWDELRRLSLAGNDIGGHTRDHPHLTQLAPADQRAEVCGDRDRLVAQGFDPVSFAYPFGEYDAATEALVRSCGYRTARGTGGLDNAVYSESMPPTDPYAVASMTGGDENSSNGPLQLGMLESAVKAAADHGGGWVPIVLHMVCQQSTPDYQTCMRSDGPIDFTTFSQFLDWLGDQAPPGTVVKTVSDISALP
jgi:peptidoglycan/xylan/chitin deacetylase (PgdA/CDA1 family)